VFAIGNVGWLAGAVAAGRLSQRLGTGRTLVGSALLFGPSLLLVPAAPESQPIPFLVAALVLATFGGIIFNVTGISFQQAVTPDRMLGRLNATRRFIVWGVIPLGSLTGGALASLLGLRETLWIGTIAGSFAFLPLLLSPVRSIGRMDDAIREHAAVAAAMTDA
jgi:MFS family permease